MELDSYKDNTVCNGPQSLTKSEFGIIKADPH